MAYIEMSDSAAHKLAADVSRDIDNLVLKRVLEMTKDVKVDVAIAIAVAAVERSLILALRAQAAGLGDNWSDHRLDEVKDRFEEVVRQIGRETVGRITAKLN